MRYACAIGLLAAVLVAAGCATQMSAGAKEGVVGLRRATAADIARMVELSELKRTQYAAYSPVFWHPAAGAAESQQKFFAGLVEDHSYICLVHESGAGGIDGFIVARIVNAPPVYDPGGRVCMIDDFMVATPALWSTVGNALHAEAERIAAQSGAVISVTVCGQRDDAKRGALRSTGAEVASEWYVHSIPSTAPRR